MTGRRVIKAGAVVLALVLSCGCQEKGDRIVDRPARAIPATTIECDVRYTSEDGQSEEDSVQLPLGEDGGSGGVESLEYEDLGVGISLAINRRDARPAIYYRLFSVPFLPDDANLIAEDSAEFDEPLFVGEKLIEGKADSDTGANLVFGCFGGLRVDR